MDYIVPLKLEYLLVSENVVPLNFLQLYAQHFLECDGLSPGIIILDILTHLLETFAIATMGTTKEHAYIQRVLEHISVGMVTKNNYSLRAHVKRGIQLCCSTNY